MNDHDLFTASRRERISVFATLFAVLTGALALGLWHAPAATTELLGLIPVGGVAAGKFLPLWAITGKSHFTPWQLGLLIGTMDTIVVVLLVYGLGSLYRIAAVRRRLERMREHAQLIVAAYPGMHKGALVAVALIVLFPVTGTGAVAGTFVGILLGLGRFELIGAVSLGGYGGGLAMAFATVQFDSLLLRAEALQQLPAVKYGLLAVVVLLAVLGIAALNRMYRRALAMSAGRGPGAEAAGPS